MNTETSEQKTHGRGLWVLVLVMSGLVSLTMNIWHAISGPPAPIGEAAEVAAHSVDGGRVVLALIVGVLPVAMSAVMSHVFFDETPGPVRFIVGGLFMVALGMSMTSVYEMVEPVTGDPWRAAGMVAIIDVPPLVALGMLTWLGNRARAEAERADIEADMEALRASLRPDIEADIRRTLQADIDRERADMEADIERRRADMEADIQARRDELEADIEARREADIAAVRTDVGREAQAELERVLSAERARMEADRIAWIEQNERDIYQRAAVETEARMRREMTAASKDQGQRKAIAPAPRKPTDDAMTSEEKARLLLKDNPSITGAELGRALGLTGRQGRRLLDKIAAERAEEAAPVTPLRLAQ